MNVTSLTDLASDGDVLQELLTRIAQLEAQDGAGYGPCLEFYKRLAKRIEDADDLSLEARSRAGRTYKAIQDTPILLNWQRERLLVRAEENMNFFEAYLVQFEDSK